MEKLKKWEKNKNKLRTIYPKYQENFKNSKPRFPKNHENFKNGKSRVQFYWFL